MRPVIIMALVLCATMFALLVTTSKLVSALGAESVDGEVNQRIELGQNLAKLNITPEQLVGAVDGGNIHVRLDLVDGRRFFGPSGQVDQVEQITWRAEKISSPGQFQGAALIVISTNRVWEDRVDELRMSLRIAGLVVFVLALALLAMGLRFGMERLAARTIAEAAGPAPLPNSGHKQRIRTRWPQSWSVRRRVVVMAVVALLIPLLSVGAAILFAFRAVQFDTLDAKADERMRYAQELAERQVSPAELARRLDRDATRISLITAGGEQFGTLATSESAPFGGPGRVGYVYQRHTVFQMPGPLANASLTLQLEAGVPDDLLSARLLGWLGVIGAVALAAVIAILIIGTRIALSPLTALTSIATRIAGGDRGARVPVLATSTTEIGKATSAFNAMLDDIEGAESRAKDAELKTRRFVADAAHELRTPLAGVQAAAEAVLHQPPDAPADERDRLHLLLVRESQRAGLLVDDLLNLARIDAGDFVLHRQRTDIAEIARQQADRIALLRSGLTVRVQGPDAVWAEADPGRVSQILANVLNNAANATPDGGQILVSVAVLASELRVSVTDNGIGVPAAERERIFDRLVRLDAARGRKTGGHGLGLAISRELARAHGGELVCAEPEPGQAGAVFVLTLPVGSA